MKMIKDKPLIKNVTLTTREINKEFQKIRFRLFILPRYLKNFSINFIIIAGLAASAIMLFPKRALIFGFIFGTLFCIYLMCVVIRYASALKKSHQTVEQAAPIDTFIFDGDEVELTIRTKYTEALVTGKSNNVLLLVIFSPKVIILYSSVIADVCVFDNSNFESGTKEDLVALLKEKLNASKVKILKGAPQ